VQIYQGFYAQVIPYQKAGLIPWNQAGFLRSERLAMEARLFVELKKYAPFRCYFLA